MSEKSEKKLPHSISYANDVITVNGVVKVVAVSEKEAQLKLTDATLVIKGAGLNVTKLEREQGLVQLEVSAVQSFTYRQSGMNFKGLFR